MSRFHRVRPLVCLSVLLFLCASAGAQQQPDVYVVSVGVDRYQPPTNSLSGCVGDAVGMARVFESQAGKRYDKVDSLILTDEKATRTAIVRGLDGLRGKGKEGDWCVIVLSGHGGPTRNQWGFLTHDNQQITDATILKVADDLASGGKKVFLLIDACHAGQLRYAASDVLNRHDESAKGGIILMISSMSDQLSSALGNFSAFARAVEEGLRGMADYDNDGAITLKELRRFTFNRVYELRLKTRDFPGMSVEAQDSAIDASLSMAETTKIVNAKKPQAPPVVDDGAEVATSDLREKSWKVVLPAKGASPPSIFEFKLDPFGFYFASLKQGVRTLKIGAGEYKIHAKCLKLIHQQGVDRLEIVSLNPSEFRYRFQGNEFVAISDPSPQILLVDLTDRLSQDAPRDRLRMDSPSKVHLAKLEQGETYVIDLMSPEFDTYLRLEDAQGMPLAEDDDGGEGRNSRLKFVAPRSGEYRLIVTTFRGGNGIYHLHVAKVSGVRSPERPAEVPVVFQVDHELRSTDPRDRIRPDSFSRDYRVELKAGVSYTIDLTSQDFDTYLRLEDPNGAPLAEDDDSGGNLNARLVFTPPQTGTYRLVATSFRQAAGRFRLTVRANDARQPSRGEIALALTSGVATTSGRLNEQDNVDRVRKGSLQKVFVVQLKAGATYDVSLKSPDFDPYLRIEDNAGRQFAIVDGSDTARQANLAFVAPDRGTYRVVVTTTRERATGTFTLTIQETGRAPTR